MTNEISVTGMILSLEEKQTGTGECFYMLDLQPFYGPVIRTQVWNKGYEFIKSNLLRADKNGINGDVIELKGYTHNYILSTKNGDVQYTTFKCNYVGRPTAKATYTGSFLQEDSSIPCLSNEVGFWFVPDVKCIHKNEVVPTNKIQCTVPLTNAQFDKLRNLLTKGTRLELSGSIDNTDKRLTKLSVTSFKEEIIDAKA